MKASMFCLASCLVACLLPKNESLPALQQYPDGTRTVSVSPLPLQIRAPDTIARGGFAKNNALGLRWGGDASGWDYLEINSDAAGMNPDPASKATELDAALTAFQVGETTQLPDGYDMYYSYIDSKLNKLVSYYSERTIAGTRYRCFLSYGTSLYRMKEARQMCRSAEPLVAPAAAPTK